MRVLGQDLALYRARSGRVVALSNMCIHRGGSLADGSVDTLAAAGLAGSATIATACAVPITAGPSVPMAAARDPGFAPRPAGAQARPRRFLSHRRALRHFVWVFLGDLPESERPPIPALPEFDDPGFRPLWGEFVWNAHYSRVVENGLDISHAVCPSPLVWQSRAATDPRVRGPSATGQRREQWC